MTLKVLYGYASIFFAKKKNESLSPVQDYKNLNLLMIKNKYILLLIFELIIKL